ncbi:MAG: glycosyltransferase [Bacteroidaceae bacterium]|nr:glycosyltransferase [Bacteroidaceae bacterium]
MKHILCITTYPPRVCGIATFSYDLIQNINKKFQNDYIVEVCAVESKIEKHSYDSTVKYVLNTSEQEDFEVISKRINQDANIDLICIQHEFGLFSENQESFLKFVQVLTKPIVIVFHTVLSHPKEAEREYLRHIINACQAVIVMTHSSSAILENEYQVQKDKISIISHGTHLVQQIDKKQLKRTYGFSGREILSTFGLLSPGKSIETSLDALPAIIKENPSILFLIIGETHPVIVKTYGETYRESLEAKVKDLNLTNNVKFINKYLDIDTLLEYLQMTDVYLFTSSDPNQAVSGTFVYALSCGCPIVATPIPHAFELLSDHTGIIFNFHDSVQLAKSTNRLLKDKKLRIQMGISGLQKTAFTAWENTAIAYTLLFEKILGSKDILTYSLPGINLDHIIAMSKNFGIIQFSKGNKPDLNSGYTLDDNARALIALCMVDEKEDNHKCVKYMMLYLNFILFCLQDDGTLKNYVDKYHKFTSQNDDVLLEDSNGRAIWALGYFICHGKSLYQSSITAARKAMHLTFPILSKMQSPRSIAFSIKGLCCYYVKEPSQEVYDIIQMLTNKLTDLYLITADKSWKWFETYLTYENAVLPESLIYAYNVTKNEQYKAIAEESFDFLLGKLFSNGQIKVISNNNWLNKGETNTKYGEQPVDVAATVIALSTFYEVLHKNEYIQKQNEAFSWFLGNNHLHQIIYNPITGGCYDGLEENNINLNQGAESTVCYLMARLSLIKATTSPTEKNIL